MYRTQDFGLWISGWVSGPAFSLGDLGLSVVSEGFAASKPIVPFLVAGSSGFELHGRRVKVFKLWSSCCRVRVQSLGIKKSTNGSIRHRHYSAEA